MTFEELKQIARKPNANYCGATNNLKRRRCEHSYDGKDGALYMYYARVPKVKEAENEPLSTKNWEDNNQGNVCTCMYVLYGKFLLTVL